MRPFALVLLLLIGCKTQAKGSAPPPPDNAASGAEAAPSASADEPEPEEEQPEAAEPPEAEPPLCRDEGASSDPPRDVGQVAASDAKSAKQMLALVDGFMAALKADDFRLLAPYLLTREEAEAAWGKLRDEQWLDYLARIQATFRGLRDGVGADCRLDWPNVRLVGAYASDMKDKTPNLYVVLQQGSTLYSVKLDDIREGTKGWRIGDYIGEADDVSAEDPTSGSPWLKRP